MMSVSNHTMKSIEFKFITHKSHFQASERRHTGELHATY